MKSELLPEFAVVTTLPPTKHSYTTNVKKPACYEFRVRAQNEAGVSETAALLDSPLALKPALATGEGSVCIPTVHSMRRSGKWQMLVAWFALFLCAMGLIRPSGSSHAHGVYFRCVRFLSCGSLKPFLPSSACFNFKLITFLECECACMCVVSTEPPSPPLNLQVAETDSASVTVNWEMPEDDGGAPVEVFVIEMRTSKETKYSFAANAEPDQRSQTVSGLKEGGRYLFRVRAENEAGSSEAVKLDKPVKVGLTKEERKAAKEKARKASATDDEKPEEETPEEKGPKPPENLRAKVEATDSIKLQWTAPEETTENQLTGYIIEMKSESDADFAVVGEVAPKKHSHIVTGLEEGHKYEFRVKSQTVEGLSEAIELSSPISIKPTISAGMMAILVSQNATAFGEIYSIVIVALCSSLCL